jgi:hypothetical protein
MFWLDISEFNYLLTYTIHNFFHIFKIIVIGYITSFTCMDKCSFVFIPFRTIIYSEDGIIRVSDLWKLLHEVVEAFILLSK